MSSQQNSSQQNSSQQNSSQHKPLSELWRECQQTQLSETVKNDIYALVERSMRSGKPGVKVGAGNNQGFTYAMGNAIQNWLLDEHHITSTLKKRDQFSEAFTNFLSSTASSFAPQPSVAEHNPRSSTQSSFISGLSNLASASSNSANEYFLEIHWDHEGWRKSREGSLL